VLVDQGQGRLGRRFGHRVGDRLVLVPDAVEDLAVLQHHAHGAAQVLPVRRAVGDQGVARGLVQGHVKAQVGLDHGRDAAAGKGGAPDQEHRLGQARAAFGGQAHGQAVQGLAHLIDLTDALHVQRRRRSRAPARPAAARLS
jgi:hypothetical protein